MPLDIEAADGGIIPPPLPPPMPPISFAPQPIPVTYTQRARGNAISALNPVRGDKAVRFDYETAIEGSDDSVRTEPLPSLTIPFALGRLIYLMDPDTDAFLPLPPVPWGQVLLALSSASRNEALRASGDPRMDDKPAFAP